MHKRPGSSDWGVYPDLVVKMTPDQIILINVSGRGDKDIFTVAKALNVEL